MKYPAQSDIWKLNHATTPKNLNTQNAPKVLGEFNQIFPLVLFPGELKIDEHRIVWVEKNGPWAENVISIMATDIACVNASSGPFFGNVSIQSLTGGPKIEVDHITRRNAKKIRNLVETIALKAREGLIAEHWNYQEAHFANVSPDTI